MVLQSTFDLIHCRQTSKSVRCPIDAAGQVADRHRSRKDIDTVKRDSGRPSKRRTPSIRSRLYHREDHLDARTIQHRQRGIDPFTSFLGSRTIIDT